MKFLFIIITFLVLTFSLFSKPYKDEKTWKIGGMIHFEEQNGLDYYGTLKINLLTRKAIKEYFDIKSDFCAPNAKVLIKKENGNFVIKHRESSSRPGIGEEMHATLLYTRKRVSNGHETLKDIFKNLKQVDNNLPDKKPPSLEQISNAYQKIIKPDFKFEISDVVLIKVKTGSFIVAKLLYEGKYAIFNKKGNPISGNFLHLTLAMVDSEVALEKEKINYVTAKLKEKLSGKIIKIGNRNGMADLEFGISGSKYRLRPPLKEKEIKVIAFDWGDTLITASHDPLYEFLKDSFSINSLELEKLLKDFRSSRKLKISEKDFFLNYSLEKNIILSQNWFDLLEKTKLSCLKPIPKMMDIVQNLKDRGIKIVLFSNITEEKAEFLKKNGYYDIFDHIILSCDIGYEKPHPKSYDILLEKIKTSPNNCIFIDNKEENIKVAQDKGIEGILFKSPEDFSKELQNYGIILDLKNKDK